MAMKSLARSIAFRAANCLLLAATLRWLRYSEKMANSKITTQEVADILAIDTSVLRLLMRQGKIAAPPILFDSKTNSTGRMWSKDDIERARVALNTSGVKS